VNVTYLISGMPAEPGDIEFGDEFLVRLVKPVTGPDDDTAVVELAVVQADALVTARRAYGKASSSLEADRGQLAVAAAVLLACEHLERIAGALTGPAFSEESR
jgi:hypothetical protein